VVTVISTNCPTAKTTLATLHTSGNLDERSKQPLKVSFLTVMPSPYVRDLFHAMHRDGRIVPRVFYMEMSAPDTHWGAVQIPDYATVLSGFWLSFLGGRVHVNRGAVRAIAAETPDIVVVGGYAGLTNQVVMRWLRRRHIPWVFWGELPGMTKRRGVSETLRRIAQRPAIRWSHGIAAIGSRAVEAYRQLSGGRCPVANIPYCCDMEPFLRIRRDAGGSPHRIRFLYCGQLIRRKGVDLLVDAFCKTAERFPRIELLLVGEGPLREALTEQVPAQHRSRVQFAGFQPVAELPRYFAEADVFVLPSRHDGWGVVVNQAAAAGMPIICSDAVGAAADLIIENENGCIFPAGNAEQLANAIALFAGSPERIREFGERSRARILDWTPERNIDRWHEFLTRVLAPAQGNGSSIG
jgi:glycosyltransferase involved in cell wall biosynthesis